MNTYNVLLNNKIILQNVVGAQCFFSRLTGLLSKKNISQEEGLFLCPCRQIHTFGMRFAIDAIFVSENGRVVHLQTNMQPNSVSAYVKKAKIVIELKDGFVDENNIVCGDLIQLMPQTQSVAN